MIILHTLALLFFFFTRKFTWEWNHLKTLWYSEMGRSDIQYYGLYRNWREKIGGHKTSLISGSFQFSGGSVFRNYTVLKIIISIVYIIDCRITEKFFLWNFLELVLIPGISCCFIVKLDSFFVLTIINHMYLCDMLYINSYWRRKTNVLESHLSTFLNQSVKDKYMQGTISFTLVVDSKPGSKCIIYS